MRSTLAKINQFTLATGVSLLLSACGLYKTSTELAVVGGGGIPTVPNAVLRLQSIGVEANCNTCHGGTGAIAWMSADLTEATARITEYTNPDDATQSRLLLKSQDGHFGSSATLLPENRWLPAIESFIAAVKEAGGPGPVGGSPGTAEDYSQWIVTNPGTPFFPSGSPAPTPADYPLFPQFSTFRFSIGNRTMPQYANILFEVRVSREPTVPNVLAYWNTRVINNVPNTIALVDGVVFEMAGQLAPFEGYNLKDRVAPIAPGNVLFAPDKVLMTRTTAPYQESMRLRIRRITFLPNVACKNLQGFVDTVLPAFTTANRILNEANQLQGNSCRSCHGGGNATATNLFDLRAALSNEVLCLNVLSRTNTADPDLSTVILRPASAPHPANARVHFNATDRQAFIDWAITER